VRTTPVTLPSRALRAAAVGLPTAQLAVASHALAGGCLELVPAVLAVALCLAGAWVVTARETTTAALLVLVGGAQVAVHGLLACTGATAELAPGVLGAHAVAAGLTVVALRRADAGLWAAERLGRLLAAYRLVLAAVPRMVAPALVLPAAPAPRTRLHDAGVRSVPARRGPPALLLRAA
jgi:hypothetical protein